MPEPSRNLPVAADDDASLDNGRILPSLKGVRVVVAFRGGHRLFEDEAAGRGCVVRSTVLSDDCEDIPEDRAWESPTGAVVSTAKFRPQPQRRKGTSMRQRIGRRAVGSVIGFLALTQIVSAHHGVTGRYDASAPIILHGTITAATFSPPHPVFTIKGEAEELPAAGLGRPEEYFGPLRTRAEDVGVERNVELSPVRLFYELADKLRIGDQVTIVALQNCLSPHQLRSTWLRLPDGEVVSYAGDWARGVDGCN
ncbi:hypothetical protein [Pseudorhizobium marinum]|uniref:hypothetical protein n=1 Tax=Pseudorhizobium marinum TaxID=1496690 RepID=UPI001F28C25C|nr:hypothetical protein [Pseudorhizobium marinum]